MRYHSGGYNSMDTYVRAPERCSAAASDNIYCKCVFYSAIVGITSSSRSPFARGVVCVVCAPDITPDPLYNQLHVRRYQIYESR